MKLWSHIFHSFSLKPQVFRLGITLHDFGWSVGLPSHNEDFWYFFILLSLIWIERQRQQRNGRQWQDNNECVCVCLRLCVCEDVCAHRVLLPACVVCVCLCVCACHTDTHRPLCVCMSVCVVCVCQCVVCVQWPLCVLCAHINFYDHLTVTPPERGGHCHLLKFGVV